eukprot:5316812-Pleurochrysis_carterae.AAC.1
MTLPQGSSRCMAACAVMGVAHGVASSGRCQLGEFEKSGWTLWQLQKMDGRGTKGSLAQIRLVLVQNEKQKTRRSTVYVLLR